MLASLEEIAAEWKLTFEAFDSLGRGLFSFEKGKMKEAFATLAGPV